MQSELIVYEGPVQDLVVDPTPEQLADLLVGRPLSYWRQGSGEAALRVGRRPGDARKIAATIMGQDGTPKAEYLAGHPQLWITQPEPNAFFVIWSEKTWWVPYDDSRSEAHVMDERCGEPFEVPCSCLVDGSYALEIAVHFARTCQRLPTLTWVPWDDVEPEDREE